VAKGSRFTFLINTKLTTLASPPSETGDYLSLFSSLIFNVPLFRVLCQDFESSAVFSTVIRDVTLLVRRSLWLGNIIRMTPLNPSGLAKERKLPGNSSMVDYSKKAKFHKVKCPQCKASILIKPTVKVCPICEGTLRFLEALKEKQYIVRN